MNLDELRAGRAAVVTVAQAASLLGVDVRTVTRGIQCGERPVLRLGKRILIPRLRLLELLGVAETTSAPHPDATPPRTGLHGVPKDEQGDTAGQGLMGGEL